MKKLLTIFGIAASLMLTACDNEVYPASGKIVIKGYTAYTDGGKITYRYQCTSVDTLGFLYVYSHEKYDVGDEITISAKPKE